MTSDQDLSAPASKSKARLSFDRSRAEIERNRETLAGGVSSNFRLNISPTPLVFESGDGSYLTDIDGNRLIDYYLGMGPMILEGTGLASDLLWVRMDLVCLLQDRAKCISLLHEI